MITAHVVYALIGIDTTDDSEYLFGLYEDIDDAKHDEATLVLQQCQMEEAYNSLLNPDKGDYPKKVRYQISKRTITPSSKKGE